ncbi:MAG: hypothetical protein JOY58_14375 [Solirubrobacterales bacterium]|nr:hypothetical protein [Solirubrobacterales bacterium]
MSAKSKDGQGASKTVSYTVLATARVRITSVHAAPLRRGCAVEIGGDERQITALSADATCRHLRLSLQGTIEVGGKLARSAGGNVKESYEVRLPRGRATGTARGVVRHGRWHISLLLPGVNLDPIGPRYLITIDYSGDSSIKQAARKLLLRLESEQGLKS